MIQEPIMSMMTVADLIAFEQEVAETFLAGKIRAPVHLSGGNEAPLIKIFNDIAPEHWVFSTWRSHYHALLHGVPRERVMADIVAGHSMNLNYPEHHFFTSAIMGGILPIACGMAASGQRAWCFVGDMCASIGAFQDAVNYADGHDLRITFVIEDNGLSTNTPTRITWDGMTMRRNSCRVIRYRYHRTYPHVGVGQHVTF